MDSDKQLPPGSQKDERFLSILNELESIKESYVSSQLQWYETHAKRPMFLFRICGTLVIILSISLPFLAMQTGIWKEVLLSIFSLAIAGLSGVNAFFHWDSDWKAYRQTQFTLRSLLVTWDLSITEARYESDVQKAIDLAKLATKQLVDETQKVTGTETGQYFEQIQMPPTKSS